MIMKVYQKDGVIKTANRIVVNKDGMQIINPTEEQILADGWVEYVEPVYEPTLEDVKNEKISEIDNYYNSSSVNNFKLNGMDMWLDPTLRGNVQRQIWAANIKGDETLTISISGVELTLPISTAELLLAELEQYAATCYNVRDKKYAEVNALEDIEQVKAYDATSGYPEQLNLTTTA